MSSIGKTKSEVTSGAEGPRRLAMATVLALLLLLYAAVGLYPFRWQPPWPADNQAQWLSESGIRFAGPGIARSDAAPPWVAEAIHTGRLAVELRMLPATVEQRGPARIITLSADPWHRNFTAGQDERDLIVRLRTPLTSRNGTPDVRVPDAFGDGFWSDIEILIEPGELRILVGGDLRVRRPLPQDPLANWNPSYRFALGNELTNDRPWLGEIGHAAVRADGRAVDYATPGSLRIPAYLWHFNEEPRLLPFSRMELGDSVINVVGFVPLGLLLAVVVGRRRGGTWQALALVAAVSACLELLQICFAYRYPSVTDLILNTLGGGIGVLVAQAMRRRLLQQPVSSPRGRP